MERLLNWEDVLPRDSQLMDSPDGTTANSKANRKSWALWQDAKQLTGFWIRVREISWTKTNYRFIVVSLICFFSNSTKKDFFNSNFRNPGNKPTSFLTLGPSGLSVSRNTTVKILLLLMWKCTSLNSIYSLLYFILFLSNLFYISILAKSLLKSRKFPL
jgi:hypothetical protein